MVATAKQAAKARSKAELPDVDDPVLLAELGGDVGAGASPGEDIQTLVLYLDEVPMPLRPLVPPAPTEREVFVDPLPDDVDPASWAGEAFGDVEEVHELPAREGVGRRGYILFRRPDAAARCVAASPSGAWSESERAVSAQRITRRRTGAVCCAYPEPLLLLIIGEGGEGMQGIKMRTGLEHLHVFVGSVGAIHDETSDARVHFVARGTSEQLEAFNAEIEEQLMVAHEKLVAILDNPEKHGSTGDPCQVLVRGVPHEWNLDEVTELFSPHGDVARVELCERRRGPGLRSFAVHFATANGARTAAAKIDATDLGQDDGKLLRCELRSTWDDDQQSPGMTNGNAHAAATESKSNSIFVGNLPFSAQEQILRDMFSKAGNVVSVRLPLDKDSGQPRGYAFVDFVDQVTAEKAVRELQSLEYSGRKLRVDRADRMGSGGQPSDKRHSNAPHDEDCSVFVGNLPYDVEEDVLREFMEQAGEVISARLVHDKDTKKPKGYAFVDYASSYAALEAIRTLHDAEFCGRPMRVTPAEAPLRNSRGSEGGPPRKPPQPQVVKLEAVKVEARPPQPQARPPPGPPPPDALDSPPTLWERLSDPKTHVCYFWNHGSAETSWTPPNDPGGYWQKELDDRTGTPYLWNAVTQEARWELNLEQVAAAAAAARQPPAVVSAAAASPSCGPSPGELAAHTFPPLPPPPRPRPTEKPAQAFADDGPRKRRRFVGTPLLPPGTF